MPFYLYENPNTGDVIEVFQGMGEEHIFVNAEGIRYKRVFTVPNAAIDANVDPFSVSKFVEKTSGKGGKMGDLWDRSKELSQKRAQKNGGIDPVREKHVKEYEKNVGKIHPTKIKK